MKNLFLVLILAFTFGCDDDDGEVVRRGGDARLVDVEAPAEDSGASDRGDLDSELPVADGILPPLDAELPLADSGLVDAEAPLSDAEVVPADMESAPSDAALEVLDSGELASDAALSDM